MRQNRIIFAIGAVAVLAIVVVTVVLSHGKDYPKTAATTIPTLAPTGAVSMPASPSPIATGLDAWRTGASAAAFNRAVADLTDLTATAQQGTTTGMGPEGAKLAADAHTAELNPPPIADKGIYVVAMGALNAAGENIAAGNYSAATPQLNLAAGLMNQITADLNS